MARSFLITGEPWFQVELTTWYSISASLLVAWPTCGVCCLRGALHGSPCQLSFERVEAVSHHSCVGSLARRPMGPGGCHEEEPDERVARELSRKVEILRVCTAFGLKEDCYAGAASARYRQIACVPGCEEMCPGESRYCCHANSPMMNGLDIVIVGTHSRDNPVLFSVISPSPQRICRRELSIMTWLSCTQP